MTARNGTRVARATATMLGGLALGACSTMDGIALPTYYRPLDKATIDYINEVPRIDLAKHAPQSSRAQRLPQVDFMVTASGGGQRAAAFTMGVLTELALLSIPTPAGAAPKTSGSTALGEVDYFTTVSGGGWAVGAYLTKVLDPARADQAMASAEVQDEFMRRLRSLEMGIGSRCLSGKLAEHVTQRPSGELMLGEIFAKPDEVPRVPYLFSAASIQTNQEPFVFTQEFLDKYRTEAFHACGAPPIRVDRDVARIPVSLAIGTSASVPGFRHTEVDTSICKNPALQGSYICRHGLQRMVLVDGGMYDNLGYKTAMEILNQSSSPTKVMVVIDASADSDLPFTGKTDVSDMSIFKDAAVAVSLTAGYATYARTIKPLSERFGIDTILLKFSGVAGFKAQAEQYRKQTGRDAMEGLDTLRTFAAEEIACNTETKPGKEDDCFENNMYRVGTFSKTSHAITDYQYKALRDLGRLAVRLQSTRITTALTAKPKGS